MEKEIYEVNLDDIIPNRFQPREKFDEEGIKELSESIKQYGLIQPMVLRKIGDKYEIIAGERRYKAATMAGLEKVPAVIKDLDDKESAEVALIENIQRQNLSAIEEARSYNKLLTMGSMTQEELAKKMGISQPNLANKLRLLNLDDSIQNALLNKQISERHARSLLTLSDKEQQKELLQKVIAERMTVRKLDKEIKNMTGASDGEEGEPKVLEPTFEPVETNETKEPEVKPDFQEMVLPGEEKEEFKMPPLTPVTPEVIKETKPVEEITAKEPIIPAELNPVNLDKIKQEAEDINPGPKKPNFDMLLQSDPTPVKEPEKATEVEEKPEFVESLDDATANMSIEEPDEEPVDLLKVEESDTEEEGEQKVLEPAPVAEKTPAEEPNVSPLIQELRQEKGIAPIPPATSETIEKEKEEEIDLLKTEEVKADEIKVETPAKEPVEEANDTFVTGDLRTAINTIRKCVSTVEKYGFVVDSEEFDFEDMYQIIVKIRKK